MCILLPFLHVLMLHITHYRDAHNMSKDVKEAFIDVLSEYFQDKGNVLKIYHKQYTCIVMCYHSSITSSICGGDVSINARRSSLYIRHLDLNILKHIYSAKL